jgi:hypothetical protein
MIDGLDADDLLFEQVGSFGQEPQELQLCSRRTDEQNLVRVTKNGRDLLEEMGGVARVGAFGAGPFRVPMQAVLGRSDRFGLQAFCADAKDSSLLVIEPHYGLMSLHGD